MARAGKGAVTEAEFAALIRPFITDQEKSIAVAVSGGGDSLALLYLLSRFAYKNNGPALHALTVDHRLRKESKAEAAQVGVWVTHWPHVTHKILTWVGSKPKTKIAATARDKRYDLMAEYCAAHGITHLFLAHHQNDQAETMLLRLSAGSGLDGLAGMLPVQRRGKMRLCRPLLNIPHARLLATLRAAGQKWVEDPTNQNLDHPRPRLRAAADILAAEGLTSDRLATTASRLARARAALESYADQVWAGVQATANIITISIPQWDSWPSDIRVRVLTRALAHLSPHHQARLEQIEGGVERMATTTRFTLGHCLVSRGAKWIKITREKSA